jgi:hypothetical protein
VLLLLLLSLLLLLLLLLPPMQYTGIREPTPPIPGVDYTIIIYPVPSRLFRRVLSYKLLLKPPLPEAVAISPGKYGRPWPYSR